MSNMFRKAAKRVSNAAENVSKTASNAANSAANSAGAAAQVVSASGNAVFGDTASATATAAREALAAVTKVAKAASDTADLLSQSAGRVVSRATKDAAVEAARTAKDAAAAARAAADQARRSADDLPKLSLSLLGGLRPGLGSATRAVAAEAERAARQAADEAERAAQEAAELAEEAADMAEELGQQLSEVPAVLTATLAEAIKNSPVYEWLVTNVAALYMDKPDYIRLHEEYGGEEIYYVNGLLTARDTAINEGTVLAEHLHRPVWLIHNPTFWVNGAPTGWTGTWNMWDDMSEAVYDRTWPETLGAGVKLWPVPTLLSLPGSAAGIPFTQFNTTTRQITHALYHANGPIAIVSHSQGCLQVRNASLTVALFRGEGWIRERLLWVASGTPLLPVEIWPWPRKFQSLVNPGDTVAQVIGLNGGPGTVDAILIKNPHHEPTQNYFPKIEAPWLLP